MGRRNVPTTSKKGVIVIGIDFGTTFSGAAWATAEHLKQDRIQVITDWPGGGECAKTPTELFYNDNGKDIDWGYEIPAGKEPVRWFKLLLLRDQDIDKNERVILALRQARSIMQRDSKTAVDLVADYLRLLWEHTVSHIKKEHRESVVESMPFHVVITVPAIWKDYARDAMRKAATKAGILEDRVAGPTTLSFAPEPEAAALSTLCETDRNIKPHEVFVVCDAGGGTVDLISYQIDSVNPVIMHESAEGTGGLCGGIFIDEAYKDMFQHRLGDACSLSEKGINQMMKDWEREIKSDFGRGRANKRYFARLPFEDATKKFYMWDDTSEEPYIIQCSIQFKSDDIKQAFDQTVRDIGALVDEQVTKVKARGLSVAGIILVGGLGGSMYLHTYLKDRYKQENIDILRSTGNGPRTSICRGAVIKGFLDGGEGSARHDPTSGMNNAPVRVKSTISRANIGVKYREIFDEARHDPRDKIFDETEGVYRATDQMQWYLKRGEEVFAEDPIRHAFYRLYNNSFDGSFQDELYQCEDLEAPMRWSPNMTKLCNFSCKLNIPRSELEIVRNAKTLEEMKKVNFELELKPSGASSDFGVLINGQRQGGNSFSLQYQ
ncbi:hypothetical protein B0T14DRAFT_433509 [Immersiella caudata]|uniref:Actin-like ATPase domain-containing protein n=1 Tax=Immersiella caudata TaxID=314043 RepID=A0AA40BWT1_9PEZI|nr:hypothetical protein B0T14DRAFT_433509 [Immersiella caudata]